jgi:Leucine-rich repeat (LRR) protein
VHAASLSHTQIRGAVTEHIGLMTALAEFKCSHNAITALPQSFGALSNLACLDCSHNSIAMLPQVSICITCHALLQKNQYSHVCCAMRVFMICNHRIACTLILQARNALVTGVNECLLIVWLAGTSYCIAIAQNMSLLRQLQTVRIGSNKLQRMPLFLCDMVRTLLLLVLIVNFTQQQQSAMFTT